MRPLDAEPLAQRSQTQMLHMQALAPNVWTDFTRGAWPQGLPGSARGSGGGGAAYIDGIVGNNAYKAVRGASALAALDGVDGWASVDEGEVGSGSGSEAFGDDYTTTPAGQRQRRFSGAYDANNDFKYRGEGLFPAERHGVAPPMSGMWGEPLREDTYEWGPLTSERGGGVAERRNRARKAEVQRMGTGMRELKDSLEEEREEDLTHPDTLGGTFGQARGPRWGNQHVADAREHVLGWQEKVPGYADPHSSRLED
jgi:hypothetical protein